MHRIPRHESKCAAFHGHRYAAELTCLAPLDDRGRVIDFGVVKERVGGWIDENWDHTAILQRDDPDPAIQLLAASNAAQVRAVRQIVEGLGLAIATPDDARKMLALKGGANVAF